MLNHTKHIRPTSSSSTISKSIPNYLEVLTPQPNDDTYLYNKKPLRETLPARSQSSLSHYKDDVSSSPIHSSNTLNNKTTKKSSTNSSLVYSNSNLSNGGGGSLKKLSKEIRDLKIEEIKTRVSNHRLKNSLSQQHENTNNMETLSKELDYDMTISTEAPKISPNNKYRSYIKSSSSNVNNDDDNSNTKTKIKDPSTEKNNKEKTEINDLFSDLTPNDYEDPSLFFLEQFLLRIMDKDYKMALPLAHEVLKHDPYNSICKEYITVLQKKIEQDEKEGIDNESEESEDDESSSSEDDEDNSDDESEDDEESSDDSDDDDSESENDDDDSEENEEEEEEE